MKHNETYEIEASAGPGYLEFENVQYLNGAFFYNSLPYVQVNGAKVSETAASLDMYLSGGMCLTVRPAFTVAFVPVPS